jgi:hypothetical protein
MTNKLPPVVNLCIPPVLLADAEAIASEHPPVHPAWCKLQKRGKHFVIRTNDLEDITEVADWARSALVEPASPLTKTKRQAFQSVIDRAYRYAEMIPLGFSHCVAVKWREKPLSGGSFVRGDGSIKSEAKDKKH